MKTCDNTSVGAIILDQHGRLLVFDRNTDPPGVAGPAGHIDDHGTAADAVIAEVAEEVGLTVTTLDLIAEEWQPNQCRRLPGPAGVGHHWAIYRMQVTGDLAPSARETRNARWAGPAELQSLTQRTLQHAYRLVSNEEFRARPGIEPVWLLWLAAAGLVEVHPEYTPLVHELIARPLAVG
ncbi:NUDIX hydrolase [Nonomuraea sp. PA05]|uniref:NUDIX hydrolase n=1 Tax=Nonomuraea sp. PA05 TaxID=2604466 RepID=UPI0011D722EA|nr:NUDIX hydrolase [Nonomuraea sp. PA05]TYB71290.1 NUDIX hydrolase [Nonomuraea sp. PA05]